MMTFPIQRTFRENKTHSKNNLMVFMRQLERCELLNHVSPRNDQFR